MVRYRAEPLQLESALPRKPTRACQVVQLYRIMFANLCVLSMCDGHASVTGESGVHGSCHCLFTATRGSSCRFQSPRSGRVRQFFVRQPAKVAVVFACREGGP